MGEIIRAARVEDAPGITTVHIKSWQTTYRGIVSDDYLDNLDKEYEQRVPRRVRALSEPREDRFTFVAQAGDGQIVGFIHGGPERENDPLYRGELYAIYLLQEYQGRGLGTRLTRALVKELLRVGLDTMLVWVAVGNPARAFYRALGGQFVRTKQDEIRGVTLQEEAYGWRDIRPLLKGAE
ncbi:MAG: GNAT family N-acetyltransferase [Ktedonobacteraceae bacterium]|nr:GNAT family N-acetyltransferase [Ktedonobacteraceae bacterium]